MVGDEYGNLEGTGQGAQKLSGEWKILLLTGRDRSRKIPDVYLHQNAVLQIPVFGMCPDWTQMPGGVGRLESLCIQGCDAGARRGTAGVRQMAAGCKREERKEAGSIKSPPGSVGSALPLSRYPGSEYSILMNSLLWPVCPVLIRILQVPDKSQDCPDLVRVQPLHLEDGPLVDVRKGTVFTGNL